MSGNRIMSTRMSGWIGYPAVIIMEAALTAVLLFLLPYFPIGHYPISYVLLTMIAAYTFSPGPAILSIFLGWFLFTYFFVPPAGISWPLTHTVEGWAQQVALLLGVSVVGAAVIQARKSNQRIQQLAEDAVKLNSVLRDEINERKQAEEALRESEEQFKTMASTMPQLAWMANADGYIFWYNQRWYEYTGTTHEQMEGWGWQSVHDPEMLPRVLERWKASIATGETFDMEFPLLGADGRFRWFLTRVVPLRDHEGRITRWFGTNTDVSEKREMEEELRELNAELDQRVAQRTAELQVSNKELESAYKEMQTLSYSLMHDLRTPLRAMGGFSDAVLKHYTSSLDERGQDYLQRIRSAVQKMSRIIDDIHDLLRATRAEVHRQEVDMSAMAQEILGRLRESQPDRQAEVDIAEDLIVSADPDLLRTALSNLLSNAWKFTSNREITRIDVTSIEQNDSRVYLIRDNGTGFNPAYADKLFVPFQRLHNEADFPGTGIGLALVERILRRHGGTIWAESEIDKGAAFYFTLGEVDK